MGLPGQVFYINPKMKIIEKESSEEDNNKDQALQKANNDKQSNRSPNEWDSLISSESEQEDDENIRRQKLFERFERLYQNQVKMEVRMTCTSAD